MITDLDIAALAGREPEQQFVFIEELARRRLSDAQKVANFSNEPPEYTEFDYATSVSAAAQEFGISELSDFKLPWPSDSEAIDICRAFRARATSISQRFLFRHNSRASTVALDPTTKRKISHWLDQIRQTVQDADVGHEKKDRLFQIIGKLQAEIDRERTPIHAVGELWMTACTYIGEGAREALEPTIPLIERICGALGRARKEEKGLPPSEEMKRIEHRANRKASNDDEIPF